MSRSLALNVIAGSTGMFWVAVAFGLPLPLFMAAVQASGQQLGAINALRQLATLGQIPAAFLVERLGSRKPVWAAFVIAQRSLWLVPALLPVFVPGRPHIYALATICALSVGEVLGNLGTAPWLSWMSDLVPPRISGRFWGRRQRVVSGALVVAAGLFGFILDHFAARPGLLGFTVVFTIATVLGVADIIIHWFVHEPRSIPHPSRDSAWSRLAQPLRDPIFRRWTWAFGAWSCAIAIPGLTTGLPGFFNVVYLKEGFGASYSQASLLLIASAVGGIAWTPWIGRMIDRFGPRPVARGLMRAGSFVTLTWCLVSPGRLHFTVPFFAPILVPQPVLLMSAASVIIGGFYAGVYLCQYRLTQLHTPAEGRTVPTALHWSLVGLIAALGPMAGGFIKDHFPPAWAAWTLPLGAPLSYFQLIILLQVAIVWLVAVPLLRDPRVSE